jgi:hypothetical protein
MFDTGHTVVVGGNAVAPWKPEHAMMNLLQKQHVDDKPKVNQNADPNIRLNRGVIMKREYARASNDAAGKGRSGPLKLAGRMPGYVWVSEDGAYYRQT